MKSSHIISIAPGYRLLIKQVLWFFSPNQLHFTKLAKLLNLSPATLIQDQLLMCFGFFCA